MLESKITIFETGIEDGIFSESEKFYPSNFTKDDIRIQFLEVKEHIANKYNFNKNNIFSPYQKTSTNGLDYPDGKYVVLNETHMQGEDFIFNKIPCDILILEQKYRGIVLGNRMADCPILIVEDRLKGVTALAHCGVSYIDRLLPIQTVESLIKEYNSDKDNLYVYVGSCAKKDSYIYDKYPSWANNKKLWEKNIILKEDGYHIDMNGAIREQLESIGITHIEESDIDTVTNDKYYSHVAEVLGNKSKTGQNFVGFFYK